MASETKVTGWITLLTTIAVLGVAFGLRQLPSHAAYLWFALASLALLAAVIVLTGRRKRGTPSPASRIQDLESRRIQRYAGTEGLFLIHECMPTSTRGRFDIRVSIWQHDPPDATSQLPKPLLDGKIDSIQYVWGKKHDNHAVVKHHGTAAPGFPAVVRDVYYPFLCVAEVAFRDGRAPLLLERYVNFPP